MMSASVRVVRTLGAYQLVMTQTQANMTLTRQRFNTDTMTNVLKYFLPSAVQAMSGLNPSSPLRCPRNVYG